MKGQVLFYGGDSGVRYAFVFGEGGAWGSFRRYGDRGMKKRALYRRNCGGRVGERCRSAGFIVWGGD
ncbi:hypothetical protein [Bartonella grahamii]|uniref:hypothetical protein n=1 Tax=Bartonella grahamii TaxID=33045 RepID=UPI002E7C5699|nr:hypothetical protein [Bartonella grahamii]